MRSGNLKVSSHSTLISALLIFLLSISPVPALAQDEGSIDTLRQMGKAFAQIAEKASPAVVGITASQVVTREYSVMPDWPFSDPFDDDFFERFFGHPFPRRRPQQRRYQRPVQGSGFIVSADGYILTNNHVVQDAEAITVKLVDGRDFQAKVIGSDPDTEVAVIKIDADNLPSLELADSDTLEVGEWVIAIGNPFGLSHTVTAGIVSAKGRSGFRLAEYEDFIQTDAAINPGNSGGPLINLDAEVVGINTAIVGPGGNIGIGFAIPINIAKFVYERLIKGEPVTRGLLGVYIRDLNPDLAESLDLEQTKGVLVVEVSEDSAADKAGVKRYDVIVQLDDQNIEKANELRSRIAMLRPGTKVELVVLSDGRRKTLKVEIGGSSKLAKDTKATTETVEKLGLEVRNLTDELAERYGYEDRTGVIIESVEPGSPAAMKGVRPGMLIMEVNRNPVKNTKDFNTAIEEASKEGQVLLLIDDGRYRQLFVLKLPKE
ncbi:MAG: Do family serine endopeptidase [Planctomycetota bacterium]|nr:MAG: Do family serine endopeptidase [Planctomycetota bacterium]